MPFSFNACKFEVPTASSFRASAEPSGDAPDLFWRVVPPLTCLQLQRDRGLPRCRKAWHEVCAMGSTFDYSAFSPSDADFLKKTATRVRKLIQRTTPVLIEIGDYLTNAKEKMPHGQFGKFCLDEVGIDLRSAENYMKLAELAKVYPPSLVSQLPARAGYKMGEKSAPAEIVAEIMTEVSAGRAFTFREVNSRLAAAKPAEALSVASDVDGLADRLLGALDMHDIGDLALLLRTATKPMLTAFCERLQQGLEQRQTTTVATCMLPQNNL